MTQASEQIARQFASAANVKKSWGYAMYNVLEQGVKGDGVTDDTAALQSLINTAIAAGRKAIFFPHTPTGGQYYVTSLLNADQVVLFGDNASFVGGYTGTINQLGEGESVSNSYINVKDFGATGDGVTDDSTAIQNAINSASTTGMGTVFFPAGKYYCTGVLTVPSGIKLFAYGGIYDGNNMTQLLNNGGATFYITNTVSPFITITGQNVSIEGLCFYYPNQVLPSASTPTVYPVTITHGTGGGPGTTLHYLTFINAYEAIRLTNVNGGAGRARIENINMGCLKTGIEIDNCLDVTRIRNVMMQRFYGVGTAFPQPLDNWCMANGIGITLGRVDEMMISDVFIMSKEKGVEFKESTNTAFSPVLGSYGTISNIAFDFVNVGFSALNTNVYGWDISNAHIAAIAALGTRKQAVHTRPGGTMPPRLRFHGGSFWGGPCEAYLSHNAGFVEFHGCDFNNNVSNAYFNCAASTTLSVIGCNFIAGGTVGVFGIASTMNGLRIVNNKLNGNNSNLNPGTNIPASASIRDNDFKFGAVTPTLPTSTTVYTNNFGIPVRVYIRSGTVTGIAIQGVATGLTSGAFVLEPQDTIAITYSVAPTWTWTGF